MTQVPAREKPGMGPQWVARHECPLPSFLCCLTHLGQDRTPADQTCLGSCRIQKQQEGVEPPLRTETISPQLLSFQNQKPLR